MISRGGSKYPLLTGGGRVRRKRGGSSVYLTYEDQKFVCHPEVKDVGDTALSSPPNADAAPDAGSDSAVLDNLKNILQQNNASTEASEVSTSEDVTPDVNTQEGGGRRRKKTKKVTTKAKPKTKKTKSKRKKSGGTSGCGLKVEGGAKKKKVVKKEKKVVKSRKRLYMEYLDKKYSKDQLMKICKKLGIKITVRKNGNIKPIKKETLIKKITVLKFNK